MQKSPNQVIMLKDLLDWNKIMKASRSAGGHSEIMNVLFGPNHVLTSYREDDYQGKMGYVYLVYDWTQHAKIVIVSDYFGSCSGCDQWEDASNDDVRNFCIQLANNAHQFDSVEEAISFLDTVNSDEATYFDLHSLAKPLADKLRKKLVEINKNGLS